MLTKAELKKLMGSNLRRIRLARGLKLNYLAQRMGITPGYLGLIEQGKRGLTPYMMFNASVILETYVSELYKTDLDFLEQHKLI